MSLTATHYEHISLDKAGVPRITGKPTKVGELVLSYLSSGSGPEELYSPPLVTRLRQQLEH
jgi:hypothetical protein